MDTLRAIRTFGLGFGVVLAVGCAAKKPVPPPPPPPVEPPSSLSMDLAARVPVEAPDPEPAPAPAPPPPDPCVVLSEKLRATRVPFDYDDAGLSPAGRAVAAEAARLLRENGVSGVELAVYGHCDTRGTNEYNLALSDRRARAVGDLLTREAGVAAARLVLVPKGEEEPRIAQASTEAEHAENRRVELEVRCPGRSGN